jgi:hypothetical protein
MIPPVEMFVTVPVTVPGEEVEAVRLKFAVTVPPAVTLTLCDAV